MPWIKAELSDDWHAKLKHYRDQTDATSIPQAVATLIHRGLIAYESENGSLPEKYEKEERPTWNR